MSLPQFVKFHNLVQIIEAFCGTKQPVRFRTPEHGNEGFSGAVVLQVIVQANEGAPEIELCLRGWPPKGIPRERLLGLHRLLDHVHRCGVRPIAVPLPSQFGSTIYTEAGQFWQVEPWLPGHADFWSNSTEQRLRNTMHVLAQWHDAATRFDARTSESKWFKQYPSATSPTVLDRLERIQRFRATDLATMRQLLAGTTLLPGWDAHFSELISIGQRMCDLFEQSAVRVNDDLESYRDARFRLHPCLRDIWHDHVLFQGDEVSGLIDPAAAKSETPATDLSRLLGSFVGDDDERWSQAIAAYRETRPLSEIEARLARILDQCATLLSGLTWLERLFVHHQPQANPARVLERMQQIATRMERLPSSSAFALS